MKTALEFYDEIDLTRSDVIKAMKEYAHQVATQALKDAADNATFSRVIDYSISYDKFEVNKESITNTKIQLP